MLLVYGLLVHVEMKERGRLVVVERVGDDGGGGVKLKYVSSSLLLLGLKEPGSTGFA